MEGRIAGTGKASGAAAEEITVIPSLLVERKLPPKGNRYSPLPQDPLGTTCGATFLWRRKIDGFSAASAGDEQQRSVFLKSHSLKHWRSLLTAF